MEEWRMKDRGVKARREDRIRAILERQGAAVQASDPIARRRTPEGPIERAGSAPTPYRAAESSHDPETEWKRKSKEWLHSGSPPRSAWSKNEDDVPEQQRPPGGKGSFLRGLVKQFAVSLVLFAAVWGVFELDMPGAEPVRTFIVRGLTEELDTEAIAAWYQDNFSGAPSFIPIFRQPEDSNESTRVGGAVELTVVAPVAGGTVVRTFAESLGGIEIAAAPGGPVGAIETGRVSQVAGSEKTGFNIVIQHASARKSIYGHLSSVSVQPGDWVEAGDRIGTMPKSAVGEDSLLYLAIQENGKYVDPTDVVRFD
jgi:stage IV sporulation protein FA